MILQPCGVVVVAVTTGEARQLSPKLPWSGGLSEGLWWEDDESTIESVKMEHEGLHMI